MIKENKKRTCLGKLGSDVEITDDPQKFVNHVVESSDFGEKTVWMMFVCWVNMQLMNEMGIYERLIFKNGYICCFKVSLGKYAINEV